MVQLAIVNALHARKGGPEGRGNYRTRVAERVRQEVENRDHASGIDHALHRFSSVVAAIIAPVVVLLDLPGLTEHW